MSLSWKAMMGRSAIDLDHLDRYTGGERRVNADVMRLFDEQIMRLVTELSELIASRDRKRWREVAHSIKGAARGVGAFSMGDLAASAEPVDPADLPKAKNMIEKLEREARAVRAFIQAYLAA